MSPADAQHVFQEGLQHHRAGRLVEAERIYRSILQHYPDHPDTLHLLGMIGVQTGHGAEAMPMIERAIALQPTEARYQITRSLGLISQRRFDEAREQAIRAMQIVKDDPEPLYPLAVAFSDLQDYENSLACSARLLRIDPRHASTLALRSGVLGRAGRVHEALETSREALKSFPESADLHWNYAMAALTLGDFETGWPAFEWRLKAPSWKHIHRQFPVPIWHRHDLSGKTILLYCEGGYGDAIQFVRYLPQVAERAAKVLIECPAPLEPLFKNLPGAAKVIIKGSALPAFDYACPMQSLPFNFDTREDTIPAQVPYLFVDEERRERWRRQVEAASPGDAKRVGLVWSGSSITVERRTRVLSIYAPLASVPNVKFFSLQLGGDGAQAKNPPPGMDLIDLTPAIKDFADSAAMLQSLDLLISIDTSVAHLAGALARPVWTLIPSICDFRWMLDREDSPWYPTMRLFRQTNRTDWNETMARMTDALRAFT